MTENVKKPKPSDDRKPTSFLAAALWTSGITLLVGLLIQVTESVRPGAIGDIVNDTACQVLAYSIVILAMLRVYAPSSPMRDALGFRAVAPLHIVFAAIAGACLYPGMSTLEDFFARRFPLAPEELDLTLRLFSAPTRSSRITLVLALGLVMPIAEEVFFRGILFGGLRKGRGMGMAIVATAVYYTSTRLDPRVFATTFVLGLVLGWLRGTSKSVVPAIVAHVAYLAVPLVPVARGADATADVVYSPAWSFGGLAIAAAALLATQAVSPRTRA